jgi:2-C-methyl-D-erythritol 2,4-cyclodiphosphate synthase
MSYRIGHGQDIHKLQPTGTLKVGGVEVAQNLSPVAHSDGDVVLHALCDALLGAMALGDIGERFPNSDPKWKGADSQLMVTDVMGEVRWRNMRLLNIDIHISLENPKLKPFKQQIVDNIKRLTDAEIVNVKAGTNEGLDAIGRGDAIAATVVLLLAGKP